MKFFLNKFAVNNFYANTSLHCLAFEVQPWASTGELENGSESTILFSLSQLGEVLRNKAAMQIAESRTYF